MSANSSKRPRTKPLTASDVESTELGLQKLLSSPVDEKQLPASGPACLSPWLDTIGQILSKGHGWEKIRALLPPQLQPLRIETLKRYFQQLNRPRVKRRKLRDKSAPTLIQATASTPTATPSRTNESDTKPAHDPDVV